MTKIIVKRPVKVKTIVTDEFKKTSKEDLSKELSLLDNQILHLELELKQLQSKANNLSINAGSDKLLQLSIGELSNRLQSMSEIKHEIIISRDDIDKIPLNSTLTTGTLENYVEIKTGDNIFEKLKEAYIIVENGIIKEIHL